MAATVLPCVARAQDAQALVQQAVTTELAADKADHSVWTYRDHDRQPGKDEVAVIIETPKGSVQRVVERHGRPLPPAERQAESIRIDQFVHDTATQARKRKDSDKDDESARKLLEMLPRSFIWSIKSDSGDLITLAFRPDPNFQPPTMESRVFAAMEGEMAVSRDQHRIRSLRGRLTQDVKFGYGLFGKLNQGGTFQVERRELAPRVWQITESHIHIGGKALLFKTIGQQEDEVKTGFKPSTAQTLAEAAEQLQDAN